MTRVFLADDHAMVRVGLRHVLQELADIEVVGEAENGRQVLNAPELARCDVLILDLSLPVVAGTEVLRRVRSMYPDLAVVVHSMHPESQFRRRALQAGAVAYVSKEAPPAELLAAVERAAHGPLGVTIEPETEAPRPHTQLTAREHEVFLLILMGRQVADIAAELDVHSCTVSNHLARIRSKLGVSTTAEMVHYAYGEGLLEVPPAPPTEG
ncbi:MAG: response regulator transcription factor [Alphaproteobacteria bacterium]|nr:response regulator transcription factor [Alphaproteobacteria bacterium]